MRKHCFMLLLLGLFSLSLQAQNALLFDGVKDFALVKGRKALNFNSNDFSIQILVSNPDFSQSDTLTLLSYQSADSAVVDGYQLQLTSNQILFQIGANYYAVNYAVSGCEHITIQRMGGKLEFYSNADLINTLPLPISSSVDCASCDLVIGKNTKNTNYYQGILDELRIWQAALSQSFLQTTTQRCLSAAEIANSDLVSYWDFDEIDGQFANNKVNPLQYARLGTSFYNDGGDPVRVAPICQMFACCQLSATTFDVSDSVIAVNEIPTFLNAVSSVDSVVWIVNDEIKGTMNALSMSLPMGMNVVQLVVYSGACKTVQTQLIDVIAGHTLTCGSDEYIEFARENNPYYIQTLQMLKNAPQSITAARRIGGIYYIPVVFHVITDNIGTFADFPVSRIQAQLDFLNTRFAGANIQFCLAQKLPNGVTNWQLYNNFNGQPGITYTATSNIGILEYDIINNSTNQSLAALLPFPAENYLNIYIVRKVKRSGTSDYLDGISSVGPSRNIVDGIALQYDALTGGNAQNIAGATVGQTAGVALIHEVGHWLGLFHVFGATDFVCDTYQQNQTSAAAGVLGCNTPYLNPLNCSGNSYNQGENYMDYFYENCLNVFSAGQIARMHYTLENGRQQLYSDLNLVNTGLRQGACLPNLDNVTADFIISNKSVCNNENISLQGANIAYATWQWSINWNPANNGGASMPTSAVYRFTALAGNLSSPATNLVIETPGIWDITLTVIHQNQTQVETKQILILDCDPSNSRFRNHSVFNAQDWGVSAMSIDKVLTTALDPTEGYIVAGSAVLNNTQIIGAVIRTDLHGNILWRKSVEAGISDSLRILDVASNVTYQGQNVYAFTGVISKNQGAVSEVLLLIMDRAGNILHQTSYPVSNANSLSFAMGTRIIQLTNGQFVICGFAGDGTFKLSSKTGFILSVSPVQSSTSIMNWVQFYETGLPGQGTTLDLDVVRDVREINIDLNADGVAERALIVSGNYNYWRGTRISFEWTGGAFFSCLTINGQSITEHWRKNLQIDDQSTGIIDAVGVVSTAGRLFAACNSEFSHGAILFEIDALTGNISDMAEVAGITAEMLLSHNNKLILSARKIGTEALVAASVSIPPAGFTIFPTSSCVIREYANTTPILNTTPNLAFLPGEIVCRYENMIESPQDGYMMVSETDASYVLSNTSGMNSIGLLFNKVDEYLAGACSNTATLQLGTLLSSIIQPIVLPMNNLTISNTISQATSNIKPIPCVKLGCDGSAILQSNVKLFQKCPNVAITLDNVFHEVGNFNYTWYPSTGLSNSNIDAPVCNVTNSITYQLSVTDPFTGCLVYESTVSVTVAPNLINPGIIQNYTCAQPSVATIVSNPAGGTPPYSFVWNNGTTIANAISSSIAANALGVYGVTVTDATGCTASQVSYTQAASALSITIESDPVCPGATGTATVTILGGRAPFRFEWSNGARTQSTNNLLVGATYNVTVTDAAGCIQTAYVAITQVNTGNLTLTPINTCVRGAAGAITATIQNPVGNYRIVWGAQNYDSGITGTRTGLAAGTYTVTAIQSSTTCSLIASTTIGTNSQIIPTVVTTPVSCPNGSDGSATVTVVQGGTAPYAYAWSTNTYLNTPAITGLNNSNNYNYAVTVTDAVGCRGSVGFIIPTPQAFSTTIVSTPPTCSYTTDGTITFYVSGATPPYTYLWPNGNTTNSIASGAIAQHPYRLFSVTDSRGCKMHSRYGLSAPPAVTSIVASLFDCSTAMGAASITASGGTGQLSYLWDNGQTTMAATGLVVGTHNVSITDANACQFVNFFNITSTQISITLSKNDVICNGGMTGGVTALASGGTSPYTYIWSNGVSTASNLNLSAGVYYITVSDANGCSKTSQITINQPQQLIANFTKNDAICNGSNTGVAIAVANGGTTPYRYLWANGITAATNTNLSAGNYNATITDANNCSVIGGIIIAEPSPTVATIQATNINCHGNNNGTAFAVVNGGIAPYIYIWGTGASTALVTGLPPGNITVTVTDANQCVSTGTAIIAEPQNIVIQSSSTHVDCYGNNNGRITLSAVGGTAPYHYYWSNGQSTATSTGLSAGNYTVTVGDVNGCIAVQTVIITEPDEIQISIDKIHDVDCYHLQNGVLYITAVGGVGSYNYAWSNGETTNELSNLGGGVYILTITDGNNCNAIHSTTIAEPSQIQSFITQSDVSCHGGHDASITLVAAGGTAPYTYLWFDGSINNSLSNLSADMYFTTITDANNCNHVVQITITEPSALQLNIVNQINVGCTNGSDGQLSIAAVGGVAPYDYRWSDGNTSNFTSNLVAGVYIVTVTDANNCNAVTQTTITEPSSMLLVNNIVRNVSCYGFHDGTSNANISGGTPPYNYIWSDGATNATNVGLMAGVYSLTITDANGCALDIATTITQPNLLDVNITKVDQVCNTVANGELTARPFGGVAPYTYLWSNGATNAVNTGLTNGAYTVTITDANGCIVQKTAQIKPLFELLLGFTNNAAECSGGATGQSTVNVTGGLPVYTYRWSNGATSATNVGLVAGVYTVTVIDANNCYVAQSTTISQPSILTTQIINVVNPTCYNTANGAFVVQVSGGISGYTFNRGNGSQTSGTFINLAAGVYTVTVTDANNCSVVQSATISQPSLLTAQIINTVNPTCYNAINGAFTVQASGGIGGYTFNRGNGIQTSGTFVNLAAGTYSVTVADANGCSAIQIATLTQPAAITSTMTTMSTSCAASATGGASIAISGATPSQYRWSNGSTTASLSGIGAGAYCVTVTNTNGCTVSDCAVVSLPVGYITITKASSVASVTIGSVYDYVLTVRRGSCAGNYPIAVTDVLPAGLQYISATATTGSIQYSANTGATSATNSGTVSVAIPSLAANATASITITVRSVGNAGCNANNRYSNIATANIGGQTFSSAIKLVLVRDASTVANNCVVDSMNLTFNDAIAAGLLKNQSLAVSTIQNIVVNGTWRLTAGSYTFAPGSTITMMAGAELILEPGTNLNLSGVTLAGCNCLWKQILVQKQSTITTNNTIIQDAQYALHAEDKSTLLITNTTFENNFIGIYTKSSLLTNTVTIPYSVFSGNVFRSAGAYLKRPFTTILTTPMLVNGTLMGILPILGRKGVIGMYLNNLADVTLINANGNTMTDLMAGVVSCGVNNLELKYLTFNRMQTDITYNANIDWQGTGVYGLGSSNNTSPYNAVTQSMDVQDCAFGYCKNGIFAKQTNTRFIVNTMSNIGYCGIAIVNAKNSTMGVESNTIESNYWGVSLLNNEPTLLTRVFQNNITINQSMLNGGYPSTGIVIVDNNIASTNAANIGANKIILRNQANVGIFAHRTNALNIYSNAIVIQDTLPAINGFRIGVASIENSNISIRCNDVNKAGLYNMPVPADNTNTGLTFGIYTVATTGELRCNTVDKTNIGISIDQPGAMQLITNTMQSHKFGLYLESTAAVGTQSYNGNRWTATNIPSGGALAYNSGNVSLSRFDVLVNASVPNPTTLYPNPSFVSPTSGWFFSNATGAVSNATCDRFNNLINQTCFELRSARLEMELSDVDMAVAENTFITPEFDDNSRFVAQRQLLEKLHYHPNHTFSSRFENSNVQRFVDIQQILRNAYKLLPQDEQQLALFRQQIKILRDSINMLDSLLLMNSVNIGTQTTRNEAAISLAMLIDQQQAYVENQRLRIDEMIDRAYSINEQIKATGIYEIHEQTVNSIYLQTFARGKFNLSEEQKNRLKAIAVRCPLSDGNAIFQARTMLGAESPVGVLDMSACQKALKTDTPVETNLHAVLSPNPTNSVLSVNVIGNVTETPTVEVFDMLGRLVQIENLAATPSSTTFDVSHLAQGMYMVKLQYPNASITKPFIVSKQ